MTQCCESPAFGRGDTCCANCGTTPGEDDAPMTPEDETGGGYKMSADEHDAMRRSLLSSVKIVKRLPTSPTDQATPMGKGSAVDAIDFACDHAKEPIFFLEDWRSDRANEWPDFVKWLASQRAGAAQRQATPPEHLSPFCDGTVDQPKPQCPPDATPDYCGIIVSPEDEGLVVRLRAQVTTTLDRRLITHPVCAEAAERIQSLLSTLEDYRKALGRIERIETKPNGQLSLAGSIAKTALTRGSQLPCKNGGGNG